MNALMRRSLAILLTTAAFIMPFICEPYALHRPIAASEINIPVSREISGGIFKGNDPVTYTLRAKSAEAPMPEGSSDGTKSVETSGGSVDFGRIVMERTGVHYYEISREYEDSWSLTHDDRTYRVMAVKFSDGTETVVSWDEDSQKKTDRIVFRDRMNTVAKKGPRTADDLLRALLMEAAVLLISIALLICMLVTRKRVRGL